MKLLFFSLENADLGGVSRVNESLTEALAARGHQVSSLYFRGKATADGSVLRPIPWSFTQGSTIKSALRKKGVLSALQLLKKRRSETVLYRQDLIRAKAFIRREAPDAVIVSHYLLLDGVPEEYLKKTCCHVHRAAEEILGHREARETFFRFNGKISFIFLSRGGEELAKREGLKNTFVLPNPLSCYPEERCEAETKKRIAVITRFSPEKNLPLAVRLLKEAMDRLPEPGAFSVELYGSGPEKKSILSAIGLDARFTVRESVSDPFPVLRECRFTLSASRFEGFSLSILEALAAGVPVAAFYFGSATSEELQSGVTGLVVPQGDEAGFVSALIRLFTEDDTVRKMSLAARQFAKAYRKETVAALWEEHLFSLPLDKS